MTKFLFLFSLIALVACSSKPKSSEPPNIVAPLAWVLPLRCDQGAALGQRLALLCRDPFRDSGRQIYEWNLHSSSWRRLTWQDGNIGSLAWWDESLLLYSSNTDERKENAFNGMNIEPSEEIYLSDRFGYEVERLSNHPGFDGFITAVSPQRARAWLSAEGTQWVIYHSLGARKGTEVITTRNRLKDLQFSSQGFLGWLEDNEKGAVLHTLNPRGERKQFPLPAPYQMLTLMSFPKHPGWLIVERQNEHSQWRWFDPWNGCDLPLERDLPIWPAVSEADGSGLIFLQPDGDQTRLVRKPWTQLPETCESPKAPISSGP